MLFCKSSTVKLGTILLICTASCVVATIASFGLVVFVLPRLAGRAGIFKHGREETDFGTDEEQLLTKILSFPRRTATIASSIMRPGLRTTGPLTSKRHSSHSDP